MIPDACMTPTADGWQRPTPEQIREYLAAHGLTTYSAAPLIGVNKATVARWVRGEIAIQFAHWSALVRATEPTDHMRCVAKLLRPHNDDRVEFETIAVLPKNQADALAERLNRIEGEEYISARITPP